MVFVLDASNRLEQQLLEQWINDTAGSQQSGGKSAQVLVPKSRANGSTRLSSLDERLSTAEPTLVAPLRVVWLPSSTAKQPAPRVRDLLLGDPLHPSALFGRRILRRHPQRVKCIAGEPDSIDNLRERFTSMQGDHPMRGTGHFAQFVLRQAGIALDIAERCLQGNRYKVPRFVAESLLDSPKFQAEIDQLATELEKSPAELQQTALRYMREVISTPSTFFIDLMSKFNRFILSLGYEKTAVYDPGDLERMRKLVSEHPTLLLWTHKTYLDGNVLPTTLFDNDFPFLHTFAGVNMSFAGLGYLARRSGAIFIRRTFQDNPLYKLVLRHYIGYLLEKRFPMSWAFEGTRSRVGKLMPPRYGLLKYVLEAAHAVDIKNIHILPVTISYDMIRDVEEYATEQSGRLKTPETLGWFLGYLSSLRRPMGRIYLDFGEPVVLEEAPEPDDALALPKIAFEVAVEANKVTPMTLPSLVTMSLLGAAPQALTAQELVGEVGALIHWAAQRQIRITSDFDPEYIEHMQVLAGMMIESGLLTKYDEGPEVVYGIAPDQHPVASYYRNSVIHHFVNKAILELALLRAADGTPADSTAVFWTATERLRDLFKFEFFYAPTEEFRQELKRELSLYAQHWESQLGRGGRHVLDLLGGMQPLVSHATLLPYVEAYTVVADVFVQLESGESLEEKDCVARALRYGRQAWLQRRISSEASIGKLLFQNGYKLIQHEGLNSGGDEKKAARRIALAWEFRDLSRRLERIRTMVSAGRGGEPVALPQTPVIGNESDAAQSGRRD